MGDRVLIPNNFEDLARDVEVTMTHATVELSKTKGFPFRLCHRGFGAAHMDINAAWQMAHSIMLPSTQPPPKFFAQYPEHALDVLNYAAQCTNKNRIARLVTSDKHTDGLLVRGFVSRKFQDIAPFQVENLIGILNGRFAVNLHGNSGDTTQYFGGDGASLEGFYPNLETDGPMVRRTFANLVGPEIHVGAEIYKALVRMTTGHVGAESYRVGVGLFQQVCTNGLLVPVAGAAFSLNGRHLGDITRKLSDFMEVVADRALDANKWAHALEASRLSPVEGSGEEDAILNRWMLPASWLQFLKATIGPATSKQFKTRSGVISPNVYGLYDAVTRWTQKQDYDLRQQIEARIGGYILDRYMSN